MIMAGVCITRGFITIKIVIRSYRHVVGAIGQDFLFVCFWVGRQYLMYPRLSWTSVGLRMILNPYFSSHVHTQMVGLQAWYNFTHLSQN